MKKRKETKNMKIYFDTEFTGLHKDTTLISIGLIAENGKEFYAEFDDYDESQCDDWIKENVIANLIHDKPELWDFLGLDVTRVYDDIIGVGCDLREWLEQFDEDIQLISDCCHYDMVLLIHLLGETAFDLPKNVNPVCHDINQDIAYFYEISDKEAFNKSREDIVKEIYGELADVYEKHNALHDAKVIKTIYENIIFMSKS